MTIERDSITESELVEVTDFESREPDYIEWKRQKVEAALRHADKHPDDFLTEREVWKKHGIAY